MAPDISRITLPDGPCIETKPRTTSIRLGNQYVNLHRISRAMGCTEGYLSKVLNEPDRNMSVKMARGFAKALGISVDDLLVLLDERKITGNKALSLT